MRSCPWIRADGSSPVKAIAQGSGPWPAKGRLRTLAVRPDGCVHGRFRPASFLNYCAHAQPEFSDPHPAAQKLRPLRGGIQERVSLSRTAGGSPPSALLLRGLPFVAYLACARAADSDSLKESARKGQAADRRGCDLGQRCEPTRKGGCPERAPRYKHKDNHGALACRTQEQHRRSEQDSPEPNGAFGAFGKCKRGRQSRQDRRERTVDAAPGCSACGQPRSGSQESARRRGGNEVLHAVKSSVHARSSPGRQ